MAHNYKPLSEFSSMVMSCGCFGSCSCGSQGHSMDDARLAKYLNSDEMYALDINGNPLNNDLYKFPRDYLTEVEDWVTGGNREGENPNLAATDLAQILFMPPTQESMNFDFSNTPWVNLNGNKRVLPVDIRTVLINTPINYPLFKPTRVNCNGFLSWRYIGDEPIHGILEGSFKVMVRINPTVDAGYNRLILTLELMDGMDFIEEGQGNGKRFLAVSPGNWDERRLISGTGGLTATNLDITQSFMDQIANVGNRYVSSLPGYFRASTPDDQLEHYNTGSTVPLGPEVRSTAWFDVTNMDHTTEALVFWCVTGQSTRGRIRVKDAAGVITYLEDQSSERTAVKLFKLPVGSVQAQIYYSGPGNENLPAEDVNNILIKRVTASVQTLVSTTRGYWVAKEFHVKREITLIPGTEYCLHFLSNVFDGASNISYGFRYEGGGLSLTFDAGWLRKKMAKNLFGDK